MSKILSLKPLIGLIVSLSLFGGCADINKDRAAEALGVKQADGSISVRLTALDIDIKEASQNEDQSELTFTLKISIDNDLCDLVDVVVTYEVQYDLNHPDAAFAGEKFDFTSDIGRVKRGHTEQQDITRGTNGPIALDSISVTQVIVRDLQNCSIDPFRPI